MKWLKGMMVGLILVAGMASVTQGAMMYSHSFDSQTDITIASADPVNGIGGIAPAPGGKAGNALYLDRVNPSSGYLTATITPPTGFAGSETTITQVYRLFLSYSTTTLWGYSGYLYGGSGEGVVVWNGQFASSNNVNGGLMANQSDTWYTVAEVINLGSRREDIYIKQGADAVITEADLLMSNASWGTSSDISFMMVYQPLAYGTDITWIDDYTINAGKDFTVVPEPITMSLMFLGGILGFRRRG